MPKTAVNPILLNSNLEEIVKSLKLSDEQKDALISKIPQMDEAERTDLLDTLKKVIDLDMEEAQLMEKINSGTAEE